MIAVLYKVDLRGLDSVDRDLGTGPQGWTYRHVGAQHFLLFVEAAFATVPMTIYTVGRRGPARWRGHARAALWTVGVMLGAVADDVPAQGRRCSASGRCGRTRSPR